MRCTHGCARLWLTLKRLLIINELRDGPKAVGNIASALEISQPNVSRLGEVAATVRQMSAVTCQDVLQ